MRLAGSDDASLEVAYSAPDWHTAPFAALALGCNQAHHGLTYHHVVLPDGRTAVTAGQDGTAKVWDLASGTVTHTLRGHTAEVGRVAPVGDSGHVVTISADGTAREWDVTNGRAVGDPLPLGCGRVICLAPLPGGEQFLAGGEDGSVVLFVLGSRAVRAIDRHPSAVNEVAASPDGRLLASVSGLLGVQGAPPRVVLRRAEGDGPPVWEGKADVAFALAFSPDGRVLAVGLADGSVRLIDAGDGRQTGFLNAPWKGDGVRRLAFSPDGRTLAAGTFSGRVYLFPMPGGQPVTYNLDQSPCVGLAWVGDGKVLATSQAGATLTIDVASRAWSWGPRPHGYVLTLEPASRLTPRVALAFVAPAGAPPAALAARWRQTWGLPCWGTRPAPSTAPGYDCTATTSWPETCRSCCGLGRSYGCDFPAAAAS